MERPIPPVPPATTTLTMVNHWCFASAFPGLPDDSCPDEMNLHDMTPECSIQIDLFSIITAPLTCISRDIN